jgi:CheY-like chemotaxis protein
MFDPFFTTKPAGSGSGMGLAMVHGIVHDHGGHIGVRTQIGAGTTFSLLLPAGAPVVQTSAVAANPDADRAAGTQPALQGRVLLVEDDALAGGYIAEQLDAWGLAVTLQRDARDALAWLEDESRRIDLLLTDLTMPHLSGLDLARRAAALRPGLPVLLVSGDLGVVDARALAEAGVRATLAKPLDAAALRSAVSDALAAVR